jgi:hypothetical protein
VYRFAGWLTVVGNAAIIIREKVREREGGGGNAQAFAVVGRFRRDVERDPPVWSVERYCAHFLQVAWARAGAHGERRGRVRVVESVTEEDAEFLAEIINKILSKRAW